MVLLYDYYKLVEKDSSSVSEVWKGAHILLFFLAFVFGSFCTFCFHMLMYMFDDNCVLFPKMMRLSSVRDKHIAYEFIPLDQDDSANNPPVDFISTQWSEASVCYIPIYVPLLSAIFGLIWTTMFLMCSSGGRSLTGLLRPWRVLPPAFLFCLCMSVVCFYSSVVTHSGILDLCDKLSAITGTKRCAYAVNVASLAYEKRIRGIYQATRLTLATAWLHTLCWILSAILTLLRMVLAADFQLVHIKVTLHGDVETVLEKYEKQISVVTPESSKRTLHRGIVKSATEVGSDSKLDSKRHSPKVQFKNKTYLRSVSDYSINDYLEGTTSEKQFIRKRVPLTPKKAVSVTDLNPSKTVESGHVQVKNIELQNEIKVLLDDVISHTLEASLYKEKVRLNLVELFKLSRDSSKKTSSASSKSSKSHLGTDLKNRLGSLLQRESSPNISLAKPSNTQRSKKQVSNEEEDNKEVVKKEDDRKEEHKEDNRKEEHKEDDRKEEHKEDDKKEEHKEDDKKEEHKEDDKKEEQKKI